MSEPTPSVLEPHKPQNVALHKQVHLLQAFSSTQDNIAEMAVDDDPAHTHFSSRYPPVNGDGIMVDFGREYLINSITSIEGAIEHCDNGGCVWELSSGAKPIHILSRHSDQPRSSLYG